MINFPIDSNHRCGCLSYSPQPFFPILATQPQDLMESELMSRSMCLFLDSIGVHREI